MRASSATPHHRPSLCLPRREFARLIWQTASPDWTFDDATFDRSADAFDNPDHVEIAIPQLPLAARHRRGRTEYDDLERRLAEAPVSVHHQTEGAINAGRPAAAHPNGYAAKFTAGTSTAPSRPRRRIRAQPCREEAPHAFDLDAVVRGQRLSTSRRWSRRSVSRPGLSELCHPAMSGRRSLPWAARPSSEPSGIDKPRRPTASSPSATVRGPRGRYSQWLSSPDTRVGGTDRALRARARPARRRTRVSSDDVAPADSRLGGALAASRMPTQPIDAAHRARTMDRRGRARAGRRTAGAALRRLAHGYLTRPPGPSSRDSEAPSLLSSHPPSCGHLERRAPVGPARAATRDAQPPTSSTKRGSASRSTRDLAPSTTTSPGLSAQLAGRGRSSAVSSSRS